MTNFPASEIIMINFIFSDKRCLSNYMWKQVIKTERVGGVCMTKVIHSAEHIYIEHWCAMAPHYCSGDIGKERNVNKWNTLENCVMTSKLTVRNDELGKNKDMLYM